VRLARELGNLPPNICNPAYLAEQARDFAASTKAPSCECWTKSRWKQLGMGSLLAVARGSANAPKLIVLKYTGAAATPSPYVLVGKGITFDTGGINLKPGAGMEEMKFDMCGAAGRARRLRRSGRCACRSTWSASCRRWRTCRTAMPIVPAMSSPAMSGKTIEVLNTDAEGRLILCDALTYAQRFEPAR
jgi:leucyl aminopeptidase